MSEGAGGIRCFMGRHCVRSIPKIKNTTTTTMTTTTTAAIDTDGNKKQFPPKRCGVGGAASTGPEINEVGVLSAGACAQSS